MFASAYQGCGWAQPLGERQLPTIENLLRDPFAIQDHFFNTDLTPICNPEFIDPYLLTGPLAAAYRP